MKYRRAEGGLRLASDLGAHREMDDFASRFDNKIDAKGRVSVPASFRAVLSKEGIEEIFCYPHLDRPALEAGGARLVEKIKGILDDFPIDSPERDEIATAYFGESEKIKVDPDGRAILSKRLRDHAGITDVAVFVGLGDKFQIWNHSLRKIPDGSARAGADPPERVRRGESFLRKERP